MSVEVFMYLLMACSMCSSLVTEAIKIAVGEGNKLPWNFIVLVVSVLAGIFATSGYYNATGVEITYINIIYMFLMGIANWVCAMVGYDKVKQALDQLRK